MTEGGCDGEGSAGMSLLEVTSELRLDRGAGILEMNGINWRFSFFGDRRIIEAQKFTVAFYPGWGKMLETSYSRKWTVLSITSSTVDKLVAPHLDLLSLVFTWFPIKSTYLSNLYTQNEAQTHNSEIKNPMLFWLRQSGAPFTWFIFAQLCNDFFKANLKLIAPQRQF